MMLAAIPGELIGLVIFAVAALLKWLGDRATEQEATKAPPRSSPSRGQNQPTSSGPMSWEVDQERIEAEFRNGVLTVTIPKSEKARRRRIEVSPGQNAVTNGHNS